MAVYVLNHFYKIRHDLKRSHVYAPDYVDSKFANFVHIGWVSTIHPQLAMILSFFSKPKELDEIENEVAYFLDIPKDKSSYLLGLLINNVDDFVLEYKEYKFLLPKNLIIESDQQFVFPACHYVPELFSYNELDFSQIRFYTAPLTAVFMVNNTCTTDCIYCYANKKNKCELIDFARLTEIIKEAHKLGLKKISLDGGEVFLYKYWKELLSLLYKYDLFDHFISTKVPITEKDIIEIKKYDIILQISLDSINYEVANKILNVNESYMRRLKDTITLLDIYGIKFQIATVLTRYNGNINCLNELHSFLSQFENLQSWSIRLAFKSLYSKEGFDAIKIDRDSIQTIDIWLNELKKTSPLNIKWDFKGETKYFQGESGSRSFKGARCSANYSNIFILPDGLVTICEQLYWKPNYLIGDLKTQSIEEVWTSPQALKLAFPKRSYFRTKSICSSCTIFDECMSFPNRCIADIIKGYGEENSDYPDPRCNKAPDFIYDLLND